MGDPPDAREVFVQAVEDHLNGTPNARHPVQFEVLDAHTSACLFCGAVVRGQRLHRDWHDRHVSEHRRMMREATTYRPPPTYGGPCG